jgi:hypothetical protein
VQGIKRTFLLHVLSRGRELDGAARGGADVLSGFELS